MSAPAVSAEEPARTTRPRSRPSLLYATGGNIPSRWAHTVQIMKMADALAEWCASGTVLTQRGLFRSFRPTIDVHEWYAISRRVKLVKLPVRLRQQQEIHTHAGSLRFERAALLYAWATRPDVVYTRSCGAASLFVRRRIRTILEIHETDERPGIVEGIREVAGDPHLLAVVTITEPIRERYVSGGVDPAKILVWPDAADLSPFHDLPTKREARSALGLPVDARIAVYCGHLYDHKGVPTVLAAAALLPEVQFLLVGGWPADIERVRSAAAHLPNVTLAGFVSQQEVPRYLAAADVVLLPNSAEHEQARKTSPLKLFEYMAARRPVVASDIPALRGVLRHDENAHLVPPDSASALARGIDAVLTDGRLAASLAGRAWHDVQQQTWKKRAQAILSFAGAL
jgi:glycosyltransferase involved in cell wall biosynthesis